MLFGNKPQLTQSEDLYQKSITSVVVLKPGQLPTLTNVQGWEKNALEWLFVKNACSKNTV